MVRSFYCACRFSSNRFTTSHWTWTTSGLWSVSSFYFDIVMFGGGEGAHFFVGVAAASAATAAAVRLGVACVSLVR